MTTFDADLARLDSIRDATWVALRGVAHHLAEADRLRCAAGPRSPRRWRHRRRAEGLLRRAARLVGGPQAEGGG